MKITFQIKDYLADPDASIEVLRDKRIRQELRLEDVAGCGMTFNAIDVETANYSRSSICQIGIAKVVDGAVVDRWSTLVNPEDEFIGHLTRIHGISPEHVAGAPTMPEIREALRQRLKGQVLFAHSSFDRSAFDMAMDKYNLEPLQVYWLDSIKIAQMAWPDLGGKGGYGLKNLAHYIGYEFQHHNAEEDAVAAAEVVLAACREQVIDIDYWMRTLAERLRSISSQKGKTPASHSRDGNPDGELSGEILVFTGELRIPRTVAADYAAFMGCKVNQSVSRKTSILVSGIQTSPAIKSASGNSSKHIKAEQLITQGHDIKIISETDFLSLIANHQPPVPLQTLAAEKKSRSDSDKQDMD